MAFIHWVISCLINLLSVVTYSTQKPGSISSITSTKILRIFMMDMSFSLLIHVCMKSFVIFIATTPLSSYSYIMQLISTNYVATVGELASYLEMQSLCLLPLATVCPLILPSLFFVRNMWDSNEPLL